jgi:hypothetical protein
MTAIPKTNAMLLCDQVITDRATNKKSLIGVFENINAGDFPCIHHALSVYVKLTDAQGTYKFKLELIDLKQDSIIAKGELPQPVDIESPLLTHELVFNMKNLQFLHPGEYEFRIFANDRIFGQKTFLMKQIKRNQPETPPG